MDNKTQEQIKADAEAYALPMVWVNQNPKGEEQLFYEYISSTSYIAGATAEHEKTEAAIDAAIHKERNALQAKVTQMDIGWLKRSQVLVDALEAIIKNGENVRSTYRVDKLYIKIARKALEQWKGKEAEPKEQQPDLGTCVECGIRKAVADYNGHQYHVCDPCNNRLNREFDKEYN